MSDSRAPGGRAAALSPAPADPVSRIPPEEIRIGQWFWVHEKKGEDPWFGCVTDVGSNHVKLTGPGVHGAHRTIRVRSEVIHKYLEPEGEPSAVIREMVDEARRRMESAMRKIALLAAPPGGSAPLLEGPAHADSGSGVISDLASLPGEQMNDYRRALIRARDEELPALQKEVRKASEEMALWLQAETIPLQARTEQMSKHAEVVENRIHAIGLYAGFTEQIVQCAGGDPAGADERLRIMQRRLYMDEECLLNYRHGGMEFKDIRAFDEWLCEPENRDRILPFPRCLVAMRVRRRAKDRDLPPGIGSAFIRMAEEISDRKTYLYIRNGDRVYRLDTDLEFGEKIFPDRSEYDPREPMMVRRFAGRIDVSKMMTRREYEDRKAEYLELREKSRKWREENPDKPPYDNPYRRPHDFSPSEWEPFSPDSLYYDDCAEGLARKINEHNKIAIIVQGLFDRSDVFNPHPRVNLWDPSGFDAAVELIYDGSAVLYPGEVPDFEAYRRSLNSSLKAGCVTVGQQEYWMERESEKEYRRQMSRARAFENPYVPRLYAPPGNPGPGDLAVVSKWYPRKRAASFHWFRERKIARWDGWDHRRSGEPVREAITVPADRILNVSAYAPGDYKRFFGDPRTREDYLQWAPLLLLAEEFHAGNICPDRPVCGKDADEATVPEPGTGP